MWTNPAFTLLSFLTGRNKDQRSHERIGKQSSKNLYATAQALAYSCIDLNVKMVFIFLKRMGKRERMKKKNKDETETNKASKT